MRVTLDSLLPLNEPQRQPTDHNADTNVSAPATVQSISHCLGRYMDVTVFLVLEHCYFIQTKCLNLKVRGIALSLRW